jgi:hypothetical protein
LSLSLQQLDFLLDAQLVQVVELVLKGLEERLENQGKSLQFLPKCLDFISKVDKLSDGNGSGPEFQRRVINRICSMQWHPSVIPSLVSTFRELTLGDEELKHVITKITE